LAAWQITVENVVRARLPDGHYLEQPAFARECSEFSTLGIGGSAIALATAVIADRLFCD